MHLSVPRGFRRWLRRVPIADPVARRDAAVLQVLMLFIGCTVPPNWVYHLWLVGTRLKPLQWLDVGSDVLVVMAAWSGLWLIRQGRVVVAMRLFIGSMLLSLLLTYATRGLSTALLDQTYVVLTIVLGGLILGRGTLWRLYGLLLAIFIIGGAVDVVRLLTLLPNRPWIGAANVPSLALSYLAIALVLDRCISALRRGLDKAERRGVALAAANRSLQGEIRARDLARQQLVHAQKVEAVGRLAGGVAHDFNNVLGVITGYAGQYADNSDPVALRAALQGIQAAAKRGAAISRKLLSFSRSDVNRPEVFEVGAALREMQLMLRQLFAPATTLALTIDATPRFIRFDRNQLELLVLNIAANARDAMRADGTFALSIEDGGEQVRIVLRDDGHGMSDTVRAHIFEPFFTTKPADSGTGLGLAVVHDLVTAAGGRIGVDSALGEGSCFTIELPRVSAPEQAVPVIGGPVHTLLVEDDDELRELWHDALEADGFLVLAAADPVQALRLAHAAAASLQLVISDLRLGAVDPSVWLAQLQQALPEVPLLLVSSHDAMRFVDGSVHALAKPCAPAELVAAARAALRPLVTG